MKTKSLLTAVLAIALSVGTVWADDDNHGNYIAQNVENIGAFENIISNASFDVEFTQRDVQKVTIYGDPAQLNNVNLTYMGNTLIVVEALTISSARISSTSTHSRDSR